MRKLLNTLYVTSPDTYLALDGENVLVLKEQETLLRVPLHTLEQILYFGYKGASPALMGACTKRDIRLAFLTPNGRFLAAACGESRGNVLLRAQQVRLADDPARSARLARCFIFGKVYNARWVLERATRDHPMRVDVPAIKQITAQLASSLPQILDCTDPEQLRGLEGAAAEQYFGALDQLILRNKEDFFFLGRHRRPPTDNVNALLSFVYALLTNDVAAALEANGLDCYIGFLTPLSPRPPLAGTGHDRGAALCPGRPFRALADQQPHSGEEGVRPAGKRRRLHDRRHAKDGPRRLADPQAGADHPPIFKREDTLGAGPPRAGDVAGPVYPRRSGRLPAIFVEIGEG